MLFPAEDMRHVFELTAGIWTTTQRCLETALRPLSMTYPQFGVLLALLGQEGMTQRELGEMLQIDRTTVSVICDSLERHGWAERRPDPSDRRAKRVFLTPLGRETIARAQPIVWDAYAIVSDVLSAEDIAVVVPKLERLKAALKAAQGEGAADASAEG
ncbi:MAG TPA: MarR family transcriptional regulator [Coriobacteriia bacterium]